MLGRSSQLASHVHQCCKGQRQGSPLFLRLLSSDLQTRSTTVLCVRKDGEVVLIADGQVTQGSTVVKPNVKKTRKIGDHVVGGFAGATADAFTLFERLEGKIEEHTGQLTRAAVELAKMWRMDKYLRRLDAALIVADKEQSLQISGNGDVLEPHDGIISIGSGSPYALAAARALIDVPGMDAMTIARKAMTIAGDACVYTNHNTSILHIDSDGQGELQSFILKGEIRKLYREFIRLARKAPNSGEELLSQIRREFRVPIKEDDLYARKYHLSDGRNRLKMLSEMLGMQM